MLTEIICKKFNQNNQKIMFHSGLNTILGDDVGTNSIGKSTFLMIIDFVFGGDDYIEKCLEVERNVGFHEIIFTQIFNNVKYTFGRSTDQPNILRKYDSNYKILEEIPITQFRNFLKEKYDINSADISFRDAVSPYFRIYQRENYDEHHPFKAHSSDNGEKCITRLIKLYNLYETIKQYSDLVKENEKMLTTYKNAKQAALIPSINLKQYKNNLKELENDDKKLDIIAANLYKEIRDVESFETEKTITIKNQLSVIQAKCTRYKNKLKSLYSIQPENIRSNLNSDEFYISLQTFFPDANIKKITEVDKFHSKISTILSNEIESEIKNLNILIKECENELDNLYYELDSFQNEKQISTTVLKNIGNIVEHKKQLSIEIEIYDKYEALKNDKKINTAKLNELINDILRKIQNQINIELAILNEKLYSRAKHSPTLNLSKRSYDYRTFDDSGTGTNYKNLIILDICLLKQTFLPVLIQDSLLFKNLADEVLENIVKLYTDFNKQIFIAFDKVHTYSENIQKILENNCVLHLGDNEKALFGFTWNDRI